MSSCRIGFVESLKKSLAAMFPRMEFVGEHTVTISSLSPIMWETNQKVAGNKYGDEAITLCVSALQEVNEYVVPVAHLRICYELDPELWLTFDLASGFTTTKKPYAPTVFVNNTFLFAGKSGYRLDEFELMDCATSLSACGVKELTVKF